MPARPATAVLLLAAGLLAGPPLLAQEAVGTPPAPAAPVPPKSSPANDAITLNFPENTDVSVLVRFVSDRLKLNILYDEAVGGKKLTLRTPDPVPVASLRPLLESALAMKGLALVPVAGKDNWFRIVPAQQLPQAATDGGAVLARVFRLKTAEAEPLCNLVRPMLTQGGGQAVAIPGQPVMLVTDYADRVEQVAKLVELADTPASATIEFHEAKHVAANRLADEANRLLGGGQGGKGVQILVLEGRGSLALSGRPEQVAAAKALLAKLDTESKAETRVFTFKNAAPENTLRAFRDLLGDGDRSGFQATVDGANLIVRATPAKLAEFAAFKEKLDQPQTATGSSRMQFYKLANTDVMDIKATLEMMGAQGNLAALTPGGTIQPGATPAVTPSTTTPGSTAPVSAVEALGAKIIPDKGTNTLIVVADPDVQAVFKQLITYLDVRRPQVLLECTIVAIDFSKGMELSVDIGRGGSFNLNNREADTLTFTQFGVSTANPTTARLTPLLGTGFHGAVLSGELADIVVRALESDSRATVSSCPRILVNDNSTGTLESTNKVPYLSVNSGNTVSTTSLGGNEKAGTTISMTPRISSGDYLNLDFEVGLSSFTGDATDKLPPPSQENKLKSQVFIPDGSTIIVGGLTRGNESHTKAQVPILGDIPLLGKLFQKTSDKDSKAVLFVFIRPLILRDDEFKDLKHYSDVAVAEAKIPPGMPTSEPQLLHTR